MRYEMNPIEEVKGDFMDDGKIWFTIRANNTPENILIHKAFKDFAKIECDNNYTLGLRVLMEYRQADFKYESLYAQIQQLQAEVKELKLKLEPKKEKKEDEGTF